MKKTNENYKQFLSSGCYNVPILEGRKREKDEVLLLSSLLRMAGKSKDAKLDES